MQLQFSGKKLRNLYGKEIIRLKQTANGSQAWKLTWSKKTMKRALTSLILSLVENICSEYLINVKNYRSVMWHTEMKKFLTSAKVKWLLLSVNEADLWSFFLKDEKMFREYKSFYDYACNMYICVHVSNTNIRVRACVYLFKI